MAQMRSSHLVIGVAVVAMGYSLTVIALARQAEHTAVTASAPECPPTVARAQLPSASDPPPSNPGPAATASAEAPTVTAAVTSATPSAPASPAASSEASSDDNRLFKFSPGGATMSRDEVLKVLALGKALSHHPTAKVSIEGFGDLPGTDPLMMGIAKHRAKVGQTLLGKAGVTEDRVTLTFSDMGSDTRLARTIRVTTTPPISEVEKP
jgi:outer membrane protein OmpA-like peptidoglycan-associated protein